MSTKYLSSITTQDITASGNVLIKRSGTGSTPGNAWSYAFENAAANDALQIGCTSSAYTTGGALAWAGNSQPYLYYPGTFKVGTGGGSTPALDLDASLNAAFGAAVSASSFTAPVISLGGYNAIIKAVAGNLTGATAGTDYVAPNGSGSGLTSLNASNLASGTVPTARLGSGTASGSTALRGDQTYARTPQTLYVETLGGFVSNTTTATVLTSGSGVGSLTIPGNFFTSGRMIRITAQGYYSTASTGPNVTIYLRFGGNVFAQLGAEAAAPNMTNRLWSIVHLLWCQTTGTSGNFYGQGNGVRNTSATAATLSEVPTNGNSSVIVDTTSSQTVNLVWQFGIASPSNQATLVNFVLEALN